MLIGRVISGGQCGVDQAALRAARAHSLPTGGWAPKGFLTEAGPAPWLADFGLLEAATAHYPHRTRLNVCESDGTLILLDHPEDLAGGTLLTRDACLKGRPPVSVCVVCMGDPLQAEAAWLWLAGRFPAGGTLNVAGPRESRRPGIGARAEGWLGRLFERVAGIVYQGGRQA